MNRRIFILSNMREYGGAEHSIGTLIPELAKKASIRVFVENDRHFEKLSAIRSENLSLTRFAKGNSPLAFARSFALLRRHFVAERPDALLANGHKGALMLAIFRLMIPSASPRFGIYIRDFDYKYLPFILRRLPEARYFAPSQAIFDYPKYREWGLDDRRTEVITNAVALPEIEPTHLVDADSPFIGCCARITPWKGIDYLIKAFGLVADKFPRVRLRIFGDVIDEDYFQALQSITRELGLEERVEFCKFATKIDEVYRQGLFFVVPSLSTVPGPESFSRIIIEAWSHAKPVIAFAAGGPKHLIDDGIDGFLVEEKNVDQLAASMARLLEDPTVREAMGARGYEKVRVEHDPATVAERLMTSLLEEGR